MGKGYCSAQGCASKRPVRMLFAKRITHSGTLRQAVPVDLCTPRSGLCENLCPGSQALAPHMAPPGKLKPATRSTALEGQSFPRTTSSW